MRFSSCICSTLHNSPPTLSSSPPLAMPDLSPSPAPPHIFPRDLPGPLSGSRRYCAVDTIHQPLAKPLDSLHAIVFCFWMFLIFVFHYHLTLPTIPSLRTEALVASLTSTVVNTYMIGCEQSKIKGDDDDERWWQRWWWGRSFQMGIIRLCRCNCIGDEKQFQPARLLQQRWWR